MLRLLFGAALGLVVAIVVAGAWVFPYYRDDRVLDKIVREVAMDWRDFGRDQARARLEYELDRAGIGLWVGDGDCGLVELEGVREVRCAWRIDLAIPGTARVLPLEFRSAASLRPDGSLGPGSPLP